MSKFQKPLPESFHPNVISSSELMNNTKDLETTVLRKRVSELEKHNVALGETVDRISKALDEKDSEIKHLQLMLGGSVPLISGGTNSITDEEIIAEQQLQRLKTKAQSGELTLEEVKKFDLLVKNKRLAQTGIPQQQSNWKDVTNSSKKTLIALATKVIPQDKPNVEEVIDDE